MLFQRYVVLGMGGKAGVVDCQDVRRGGEGAGEEGGVEGGLSGAQVQGFETAVGEEAVEGGGHGADGVLKEGEAVVECGGVEGGDAHEDVLVWEEVC